MSNPEQIGEILKRSPLYRVLHSQAVQSLQQRQHVRDMDKKDEEVRNQNQSLVLWQK